MTVAVKNNKASLVVPPAVLRKARFKRGQEVEFRTSGGVITIIPKPPTAHDEYTPEQRRVIDARLAKSDEDIKAGRIHGPFTAKQSAAFIEALANERGIKKANRPRR